MKKKKFTDMVSDSPLQLTFKKFHLLHFSIEWKNIHNYLKTFLKYHSLSQLCICLKPYFVYILQPKSLYYNRLSKGHIRFQLSSTVLDIRFAKIQNNTILVFFLKSYFSLKFFVLLHNEFIIAILKLIHISVSSQF